MGTGSEPVPWEPVPSTFPLKKNRRPSEACFWDFRREIPFAYGVLCDSFRKADDQAGFSGLGLGVQKIPLFWERFLGGKVGQRHMAGWNWRSFWGSNFLGQLYAPLFFFYKKDPTGCQLMLGRKSLVEFWDDKFKCLKLFREIRVSKNGIHQHLN